ncbi:MAG: EF-P beta-lysylation protein EpmB [Agarilytica sp.]
MIPRTIPTWQSKSWQEELSNLITDPTELFSLLKLDSSLLPSAIASAQLFPLRSTHAFVNRIETGNIDDPLLRQILPLAAEQGIDADYSLDPLEEAEFTPIPGLIHKYTGRVLLVAANQCAINCRYCFRRHFDYQANSPSREQWNDAFRYIQGNTSIDEVILSGGDPLAISDKQLSWMITQIESIPHVSRLRIHSRLPIVAPSRVTDTLIESLRSTRLSTVMVIHCNHSQEIDNEVCDALKKLKTSDCTLLNQSVLLRGVNDSEKALTDLSLTLFRQGVLPYYLHLLDKVTGTSHFNVELGCARSLYQALLANLPGYLVPKLVKETPNAPSKVPII